MNMHVLIFGTMIALMVFFVAVPAQAHKPIAVDGGPTDAATAYVIDDVDISQVVYHEAKPGQPEVWLSFEIEAGTTLDLQLGVPLIERYAHLRPAMALLGPGLDEVELPFAIPEGYGAMVFTTEGQDPDGFHEEFTGTESWRFEDVSITVPVSGKYYLVAYLPSGEPGKLWMAIGVKEQFGLMDIVTLPRVLFQVRAFHEIGPFGGILFWAMAAVAFVLFLLILFFLL